MIYLGLHRCGSFELHVESYLQLLKQLLVAVQASKDGFDEGFEERLDDGRQRLDRYRSLG